jgi:hypothetical protein
MHGIYNYTPETNHVSGVYSVAAVLYLLFVLHVMLFCQGNMFCTFPLALSVVCSAQCSSSVQYGCFCSSLISFNFVLSWYVAQVSSSSSSFSLSWEMFTYPGM